jgi:hypothetical protein
MARKPPQPLTLTSDSIKTNANDQNFLETPTPLSPKSPKSPKSPFRFTTKKTQLQAENTPSMHVADLQTRSTLPPSQTTPSLSTLHYPAAAGGEEGRERERERPTRSGFFSNYKASKSSSRLQSENAKSVNEEMSRDSDRPAMTGKGSSNESARNGKTTYFVYSLFSLLVLGERTACAAGVPGGPAESLVSLFFYVGKPSNTP